MESVGQTLSHMNRARQFNYEDLVAQILADQEVAAFIQAQSLSEQEIRRSIYLLIRIILPKAINRSSP